MAALCEHIARRSNFEDHTQGSFWEDRFKCRDLADEAAILVCGIYIDVNQIRAGETRTPESSTHTSAYDRCFIARKDLLPYIQSYGDYGLSRKWGQYRECAGHCGP